MDSPPQLIAIGIVFLFALIFLFQGVQRVPDGHSRVVERLGKRHKVIKPGIGFIIPFLDRIKKSGLNIETLREGAFHSLVNGVTGDISMAETVMDPPPVRAIAKDNTEVDVDPIGFFRIIEPTKTVYDVESVGNSLLTLIETTLRQEVGRLDADTLIASRDRVSELLRQHLTEAASSWGIQVTRVEIESIQFTDDVQEKLSEARKSELIRRGEVVEAQARRDKEVLLAEGAKQSEILKAEGVKQARILEAEGKRQEEILHAEGEFEKAKLEAEGQFLAESRAREGLAQGYAAMVGALAESPEAVVALEALKSQISVAESIGNSENTLILPAEAAGIFGAVGALTNGLDILKKNVTGQNSNGTNSGGQA